MDDHVSLCYVTTQLEPPNLPLSSPLPSAMSTIKVGSLIVRTLAKPVANYIKNQAKQHPSFRDFCINVAQTAHRLEMTLKMNFLGYKKEVIRPLNNTKAIEMGANFLSDSIIFAVAATLITVETARYQSPHHGPPDISRISTNRRNHFIDDSINRLEDDAHRLNEAIAETQALSKKLQKQVHDLRQDNMVMRTILDEILSVSMGLRHHTAYDGSVVMTIPGLEASLSKENMIPLPVKEPRVNESLATDS
ncbi:optic atrophy 3 protein-domain-containing protein [Jimgerdemannia flammicorona]|uniref:Optic atrophy 3 protein-domain-containing protein n=1 Tax=Jimgerdemannia flammicorona TaxID=994334 RepID=A0A433DE94_9FUNG|nr:optic atrophy 3 protein-domain-containing protein [Jimgerdemannia flammicorona]